MRCLARLLAIDFGISRTGSIVLNSFVSSKFMIYVTTISSAGLSYWLLVSY